MYQVESKKQNSQKFFDFTVDDINEYLSKFRVCILEGRYSISCNDHRKQNMDFIEDYKIDSIKEKEILCGLKYDDFCYAVENNHSMYPHEVLYIFCKKHELDHWGVIETMDIYIKVNMLRMRNGDLFSVVVSFHKRNFDIDYLFK